MNPNWISKYGRTGARPIQFVLIAVVGISTLGGAYRLVISKVQRVRKKATRQCPSRSCRPSARDAERVIVRRGEGMPDWHRVSGLTVLNRCVDGSQADG